jgi:hypothetical protein
MSIYFRSLKYGSTIDCSFMVEDGSKPYYPDVHIGETVRIYFDVSRHKANEMNSLVDESVRAMRGLGKGEWMVLIPFKVVDRWHNFAYRKLATLQRSTTQIFLEAENGYWEDVFLWIVRGETPKWAEPEPDKP